MAKKAILAKLDLSDGGGGGRGRSGFYSNEDYDDEGVCCSRSPAWNNSSFSSSINKKTKSSTNCSFAPLRNFTSSSTANVSPSAKPRNDRGDLHQQLPGYQGGRQQPFVIPTTVAATTVSSGTAIAGSNTATIRPSSCGSQVGSVSNDSTAAVGGGGATTATTDRDGDIGDVEVKYLTLALEGLSCKARDGQQLNERTNSKGIFGTYRAYLKQDSTPLWRADHLNTTNTQNEDPIVMQHLLNRFEANVLQLYHDEKKKKVSRDDHQFSALYRAMEQDLSFVQNKDLQLAFLRTDNHDPNKAARRYKEFFEVKMELFGSAKLTKHITLVDDFDSDDIESLTNASIQLLPLQDCDGRHVLISLPGNEKYKTPENLVCTL